MKYTKTMSISGSWVKAGELKNGTKAKIVSETAPAPSTFLNKDGTTKMQDVTKVKFQGATEPVNVSLNRATINGLVDAFGEDSKDWQNHILTVETEKVRVAGKAVVAMYLIPEGYKKVDDANGYAMIVKDDVKVEADNDIPIINEDVLDEDPRIDDKDMPF